MNLSGARSASLRGTSESTLGDILVVADDVNLPLGRLRARPRGSAGGHNGLKSIIEQLGTRRVRAAAGRRRPRRPAARPGRPRARGFDADERPLVTEAVGRAAADASELFVAEGIEPVMNRFNGPGDEETAEDG